MSLKIVTVQNGGTPQTEFVLLRVSGDGVNLGNYAIVDKTFTSAGQESNEFRHIYAFPETTVPSGALVVLCTGKGENGRKVIEGENAYIFFWNSRHCVWNDNGNDIAVLIEYLVRSRKRVQK